MRSVRGILVFFVATLHCVSTCFGNSPPGPDPSDSGFIKLDNSRDAHLFYWFFSSKGSPTDPLVLWLSGGPGCSSEFALLEENGPYKLAPNISLIHAKYGWSEFSNLLYVDQPVNVGYSYSRSDNDTVYGEKEVSEDMYAFMRQFFIRFPHTRDLDLYITGESYAGHYIPAITHRILAGNAAASSPSEHMRMAGMAIGNGNVDPGVQYAAFTDFAFNNNLISWKFKQALDKNYTECGALIEECKAGRGRCGDAHRECHRAILFPLEEEIGRRNFNGGKMNQYDIRLPCCYDFSQDVDYFKKPEVKAALGVPEELAWYDCSDSVQANFIQDWMLDVELVVPSILASGVRVLVYAGDQDFVCNWLGNQRWVRQMKWPGHDAFNAAPVQQWTPEDPAAAAEDQQPAGEVQTARGLTFIKVYQSGHMVPRDQPLAAYDMIRRFLRNENFAREVEDHLQGSVQVARKIIDL